MYEHKLFCEKIIVTFQIIRLKVNELLQKKNPCKGHLNGQLND